MVNKIGFIGAGNMGGCLIEAACKSVAPEKIFVYDKNEAKTNELRKSLNINAADIETVVNCDIIVLGVKPQIYKSVIDSIKGKLNTNSFIVSMAAGITISSIKEMFNRDVPVIRIMPNIPCKTGEGVLVYSLDNKINFEMENSFKEIFSKVGLVDKIDESIMDAVCAVTGCGPAFVYMFIQALADGGVSCGITRDKATLYAAQMLCGAAKSVLMGGHPEVLKDSVCSPGGSTIEGVLTLENLSFRSSVTEAVKASFNKNKELGKK